MYLVDLNKNHEHNQVKLDKLYSFLHPNQDRTWKLKDLGNRDSESVVFNSGQKMALRAFYFIRALTKALTYYYINRSQRRLLAPIENN